MKDETAARNWKILIAQCNEALSVTREIQAESWFLQREATAIRQQVAESRAARNGHGSRSHHEGLESLGISGPELQVTK